MPDIGVTWTILGTVFILVTPLYIHYVRTKIENRNQEDNADDIQDNENDISVLKSDVQRIKYDISLIKNDLQVIHDLVAQQNHCGAEDCRWCECHDEEDEE